MKGRDEEREERRFKSGFGKACGRRRADGSDNGARPWRSASADPSEHEFADEPVAVSCAERWLSRLALALLIIAFALVAAFALGAA